MQPIENKAEFASRFSRWNGDESLVGYPFVENRHAPFTPMPRALPMINLGLISSAGAYIDGTEPFDTRSNNGDVSYRELPIEVDAADLRYAARGYDPSAVTEDRNALIPIDRLLEYQQNSVIGSLNGVVWSLSSYIPDAGKVSDELCPKIVERLKRYDVSAALLIPATRLCHQTLGIVARAVEAAGIPTMLLSIDTPITDKVRPPRTAYYSGTAGAVAGKPNWSEFQLRVLDEALRWIETFDQPGSRKLAVEIESQVEAARGER